jgi:ubiquinone/menaquinone biosynthesis C-methylase UbiE
MLKKKFSYEEPKTALNSRIAAHQKYSDFSLHEWLPAHFNIQKGDRVLDVGCGNGNFIPLFWHCCAPNGFVQGMDKNPQLIVEAQARCSAFPQDHVRLDVQDFDQPLPSFLQKFNWIFAIYSIYYTEDSLKLLQTLKDVLAPGGTFVIIGPGPKNVKDLTDFSTQVTGRAPNAEHTGRIQRIAQEFHPLFQKIFHPEDVSYEEIDSVMEFPDALAYAEYYWSTLLWRESIEGLPVPKVKELKEETLRRVSLQLPAQIKKQISVLAGKKRE